MKHLEIGKLQSKRATKILEELLSLAKTKKNLSGVKRDLNQYNHIKHKLENFEYPYVCHEFQEWYRHRHRQNLDEQE